MKKRDPRRDKIEANATYATKFGKKKRKSLRRKLRRKRTLLRETLWLESVGIDPKEGEAPIA